MIRIDITTTPFAIESNLPSGCTLISRVEQQDNFINYLEPLHTLIENLPETEQWQGPTEMAADGTFHDFIQTLPEV